MTRRRIAMLCGLVATIAASIAVAGAGASTGANKTVRIAFFNPVAANAYTASTLKAVQKVAKKMGATVTAFDAGFDQNKQISQMQDAIVSKQYDAFIVMPANGAVLVQPTKAALKAGIKVVATFNNIGPNLDTMAVQVPGVSAFVGTRLSVNGQLVGKAIVQACGSKNPCNVVYMPGSFKQATEKIRLDGLKSVTGSHKNIKLLASAEGGYLADPALKAATDVLQANPQVDVFATSGDQMMTGILQAVKNAGKLGKIKLIGNGTTIDGVKWTRQGILFADPVALPATEGEKAAEAVIDAVRGKKVKSSINALDFSPVGPVATKANLTKGKGTSFQGQYAG